MKKLLNAKRLVMCVVVALCVSMMSVSAFAADSEIATAMSSGLDSMKTDLFALFAIVIPVGLLIFGAFFGIKKAISMLRSTSGG